MEPLLDEATMEAVLARECFGRLAFLDGDRPYVDTCPFVAEHARYLLLTLDDRVRQAAETEANACFQVESVDRLRWQSVLAWGVVRPLGGDDEGRRRAELLMRSRLEAGLPMSSAARAAALARAWDEGGALVELRVTRRVGESNGSCASR